jgi:hypothetical protein
VTPFCDGLSTSFDRADADALLSQLVPVIDAAGGYLDLQSQGTTLYRLDTGTIRAAPSHGVFCVSTSGVSMSRLRACGLDGEFLATLGCFPHRVTGLHATLELAQDGGPVVAAVAAKGRTGVIALSQKTVPAAHVMTHLGLDVLGALTGTVYIGSPKAEVRAAVYDKRKERIDKGYPDPGPLVRYEVRCRSKVGATLRDAYDPERLFYHFASPDLLPLPQGVQPWAPNGLGFYLEKRKVFTPAELMERRLEASGDIQRLLDLAVECGPHGFDYLIMKLRNLAAIRAASPPGQPRAAARPQAEDSGSMH